MSGADDKNADQVNVDPDAPLVRQAKRELPYRTQAYEALLKRYDRLIFSVSLRVLGNRADAEDASQDVMFKVFGALPSFEGRSTFKTWLMRITTNTCLTARSRQSRRRDGRDRLAADPAVETTTRIPTERFDVETVLESVREEDRVILTLRYVADLPIQEIADITGNSLSGTKMRLYRATDALRANYSLPEKK